MLEIEQFKVIAQGCKKSYLSFKWTVSDPRLASQTQ